MYASSDSIKRQARESLLGYLRPAVLAVLLAYMIRVFLSEMTMGLTLKNLYAALALSVFIQFITLILTGLFEIGLSALSMNLLFSPDDVSIRNLFTAFRGNTDTVIRVWAFFSLLTIIFYLPFNILSLWLPGNGLLNYYLPVFGALGAGILLRFVLTVIYGTCSFILLDFPDLTAREILRSSRRQMNGNRGRFLRLYLSFLPLFGFSILSFGIGGLWVEAYLRTAKAVFYKDLMSVNPSLSISE